jgi:hypothetical protein
MAAALRKVWEDDRDQNFHPYFPRIAGWMESGKYSNIQKHPHHLGMFGVVQYSNGVLRVGRVLR